LSHVQKVLVGPKQFGPVQNSFEMIKGQGKPLDFHAIIFSISQSLEVVFFFLIRGPPFFPFRRA
jgi:hypothetical protein